MCLTVWRGLSSPGVAKGCADTLDATSQLGNKLPVGVLPSEGSTDA